MRKVAGVYGAPHPHWVGDGFPVRSLFSHASHGQQVSPFLLLDYAGPARFAPTTQRRGGGGAPPRATRSRLRACAAPARFEPTTQRRGVGAHPHRGFETVTIVYAGEVEHR